MAVLLISTRPRNSVQDPNVPELEPGSHWFERLLKFYEQQPVAENNADSETNKNLLHLLVKKCGSKYFSFFFSAAMESLKKPNKDRREIVYKEMLKYEFYSSLPLDAQTVCALSEIARVLEPAAKQHLLQTYKGHRPGDLPDLELSAAACSYALITATSIPSKVLDKMFEGGAKGINLTTDICAEKLMEGLRECQSSGGSSLSWADRMIVPPGYELPPSTKTNTQTTIEILDSIVDLIKSPYFHLKDLEKKAAALKSDAPAAVDLPAAAPEAPPSSPQDVLEGLKGLKQKAEELAESMKSKQPQLSEEPLQKAEELLKRGKKVAPGMQQCAGQQENFDRKIAEFAAHAAINIAQLLEHQARIDEFTPHREDLEFAFDLRRDQINHSMHRSSLSYSRLKTFVLFSSSSRGYENIFSLMAEAIHTFREDRDMLMRSLRETYQTEEAVQKTLKNLDFRDKKVRQYYEKLLRSQQKAANTINYFIFGLQMASAALTFTAPAAGIALSGFTQLGGQLVLAPAMRRMDRTLRSYHREQELSLAQRGRLGESARINQAHQEMVLQQQEELYQFFFNNRALFVPAERRQELQSEKETLTKNREDLNRRKLALESEYNGLKPADTKTVHQSSTGTNNHHNKYDVIFRIERNGKVQFITYKSPEKGEGRQLGPNDRFIPHADSRADAEKSALEAFRKEFYPNHPTQIADIDQKITEKDKEIQKWEKLLEPLRMFAPMDDTYQDEANAIAAFWGPLGCTKAERNQTPQERAVNSVHRAFLEATEKYDTQRFQERQRVFAASNSIRRLGMELRRQGIDLGLEGVAEFSEAGYELYASVNRLRLIVKTLPAGIVAANEKLAQDKQEAQSQAKPGETEAGLGNFNPISLVSLGVAFWTGTGVDAVKILIALLTVTRYVALPVLRYFRSNPQLIEPVSRLKESSAVSLTALRKSLQELKRHGNVTVGQNAKLKAHLTHIEQLFQELNKYLVPLRSSGEEAAVRELSTIRKKLEAEVSQLAYDLEVVARNRLNQIYLSDAPFHVEQLEFYVRRLASLEKSLVAASLYELRGSLEQLHEQALTHFKQLKNQNERVLQELEALKENFLQFKRDLLSAVEMQADRIIGHAEEKRYEDFVLEQMKEANEDQEAVSDPKKTLEERLRAFEDRIKKSSLPQNTGIIQDLNGSRPYISGSLIAGSPHYLAGALALGLGLSVVPNLNRFLQLVTLFIDLNKQLNTGLVDPKVKGQVLAISRRLLKIANSYQVFPEKLPEILQALVKMQSGLLHPFMEKIRQTRAAADQILTAKATEALGEYQTRPRSALLGTKKFWLYEYLRGTKLNKLLPEWDFQEAYRNSRMQIIQVGRDVLDLAMQLQYAVGGLPQQFLAKHVVAPAMTRYFGWRFTKPWVRWPFEWSQRALYNENDRNNAETLRSRVQKLTDFPLAPYNRKLSYALIAGRLYITSTRGELERAIENIKTQNGGVSDSISEVSTVSDYLTLHGESLVGCQYPPSIYKIPPDLSLQAHLRVDLKQRIVYQLVKHVVHRKVDSVVDSGLCTTWEPSLEWDIKKDTVPFATVKLHVPDSFCPAVALEISEESPITAEDVPQIQPPVIGSNFETPEEYDTTVSDLQRGYLNFLEGKDNSSFEKVRGSSVIIPGIVSTLIPLAFPAEFLRALRLRIQPSFTLAESLGYAFVPCYDFSPQEGVLSIIYGFTAIGKKDFIKCFKIPVARFDALTVEAFMKDPNTSQWSEDPTEFLIQAMYSGMAEGKLGLPGSKSYRLQKGFIAPSELPFPGIYRLMQAYPKFIIDFESRKYTEEVMGDLEKALETNEEGTVGMQQLCLLKRPPLPEFFDGFPNLWEAVREQKKGMEEALKGYQKYYELFLAGLVLMKEVNSSLMSKYLSDQLHLFPADQVEELFELFASGSSLRQDAESIANFCEQLAKPYGSNFERLELSRQILGEYVGTPPEEAKPAASPGKGSAAGVSKTATPKDEDLTEGDTFTIDGQWFYIAPTVGFGTCGLHALKGEVTELGYFFPRARVEFPRLLKSRKEEKAIQEKWEQWMVNLLKDWRGTIPSFYAKMVFGSLEMGELQELSALKDQENELLQTQERLFAEAFQQHKERLTSLIKKPIESLAPVERNKRLRESLNEVMSALQGTLTGKYLEQNQKKLEDIEQSRERVYLRFVRQPKVFEAYLKAIENEDYYLSIDEIDLAACLFGVRTAIYHFSGGQVTLEGRGGITGEEVVIFHRGAHYSRCLPVTPKMNVE